MDALGLLLQGFAVALQPLNLALVFLGCLVGTLIGVLPGLGPISAVALLLPMVFALKLPPESALILLAGIYYGAMYGGSTTSILLNVPGEAASVVTALDGYKLAQRGQAGPALAVAAWGSFIAGTLAVLALMVLGPLVAKAALRFGPAEYFALTVFALSSLSALGGRNLAKALLATALGLLLATVGQDPQAGISRFTLGLMPLEDGVDFVVVAIGLFAVSEVLLFLEAPQARSTLAPLGRVYLSLRDFLFSLGSILRGTGVGFFVGLLPGAGASVASFLAYMVEKRWLGPRGRLGEGDLRGVASPESANNAAAGGALVPLLTLGLPGSGTTAVMLAALMSLGVTPGPQMFEKHPQVVWGLIASMYVGNLILLVLNLPLVVLFVQVLRVPAYYLLPSILAISFVGVYAVNHNPFDLLLMTAFGFLGYLLRKLEVPLPPILLGLVLGYLMEINLRRALILGAGDPGYLFGSPTALAFWGLSALVLLLSLVWAKGRPGGGEGQ
ncbi:MAG: tripartite tricarboxylate transporter permease [Thermus sp.]|uniref:tripartite tricarboxylate transporter permease n=1 Tax=Thermus sp. TaxID=275 RepID=UPI0025D3FB60|nr:tripartite tricarboxylate transporter permease [Thermus sp.]MCS7219238.1 tripartite tricarboxylate transporter permease [Thermus sp.]MDW8018000.1 tripartite tricarboxylate transporter permease [Thermus sp.]